MRATSSVFQESAQRAWSGRVSLGCNLFSWSSGAPCSDAAFAIILAAPRRFSGFAGLPGVTGHDRRKDRGAAILRPTIRVVFWRSRDGFDRRDWCLGWQGGVTKGLARRSRTWGCNAVVNERVVRRALIVVALLGLAVGSRHIHKRQKPSCPLDLGRRHGARRRRSCSLRWPRSLAGPHGRPIYRVYR